MKELFVDFKVQRGLDEGNDIDLSRNCLCFGSEKHRKDSSHTSKAVDGLTGLKCCSLEYSVMR